VSGSRCAERLTRSTPMCGRSPAIRCSTTPTTPELQLWVAARLYRGTEDVYRLLHGNPSAASLDVLYRHCRRFGTTLQVSEERWPGDRSEFDAYWSRSVAEIEVDDVTRPYLIDIANLAFLEPPLGLLGASIARTVGPFNRFLTTGFLHQAFRDELGLPWDRRRQRAFDALTGAGAAVTRSMPPSLRALPFNAYLLDFRRRLRSRRAVV